MSTDRTKHPRATIEHSSTWNDRHVVALSVGMIITMLLIAAVLASFFLARHWNSAANRGGNPDLEVVRTSLQVLGVVVFGAFVTLGGATIENARRQRALQAEVRHRDLEIRSGLLDRAASCAQEMFIHYKHVKRKLADAKSITGRSAQTEAKRSAITLLDAAYIKFSTESNSLQTLINARFVGDEYASARLGSNYPATRIPVGVDQACWRWHQVDDLLTVLYFSLTEDWRNGVLEANSRGSNDCFHSGLELAEIWRTSISASGVGSFAKIRKAVVDEYLQALPEFVESVLCARPRDGQSPSR